MIPQQTIDQILSQTNIEDIVGEVTDLKKSGSNYKACCPFLDHDDTVASFSVSTSKQIFKCFSCQRGGNAFTFLQAYHNMSFVEAVKTLGARLGIKIDYVSKDELIDELLEIHEEATVFFSKDLGDKVYFGDRGLSPEIVEAFRLGFDGNSFKGEIDKHRSKVVNECGLFYADGFHFESRFKDRFVFPLIDLNGRTIGFAGTNNKVTPKYLNSPETSLFDKSSFLYGFYQAKKSIIEKKYAIVVEGPFDCLQMHRAGFTNTVAICGTALTKQHAKMLSRFTKAVILFLDGDKAGNKAVDSSFVPLFEKGVEVFVADCPKGDDPDSMLYDRETMTGADVKVTLALVDARSWFDVKVKPFKTGDAANKTAIINRVKEVAQEIEDASKRSLFIDTCSDLMGIDAKGLRVKMSKSVGSNSSNVTKGIHSQAILLSAVLLDKSLEIPEEVLDSDYAILYSRIKQAGSEADLYNNLTAGQSQMMQYVETIDSSFVYFDSALRLVKKEQINAEIKSVLKEIEQREVAGANCLDLTRKLNALLAKIKEI